uniref:Uncharacterized protein n=1 Tax=Sus scrofa TaxID=9823 RepID=A0A8D1X1C0_PIG
MGEHSVRALLPLTELSGDPSRDFCQTRQPQNMSVSRSTEDSCELDLVYVTERIIAVSFPSTANEDNFRSNLREVAQMLKSKHGGNYLVRMGPLARWPSIPVLSACHLLMVHLPCASFSFTCLWPRASLVA